MPQVVDRRRPHRRLTENERSEGFGGQAVFIEPPIVVSEKTKKRFQDLMIVKLMRRGVSQLSVAKLLNVNESFVRHRLDIMPREVFEYYAHCNALGSLESD